MIVNFQLATTAELRAERRKRIESGDRLSSRGNATAAGYAYEAAAKCEAELRRRGVKF